MELSLIVALAVAAVPTVVDVAIVVPAGTTNATIQGRCRDGAMAVDRVAVVAGGVAACGGDMCRTRGRITLECRAARVIVENETILLEQKVSFTADAGALAVIATVPIESYVAGVVSAELGDAPAEAESALAVVARTYARRAMARPRHKNAPLCDRAHCQVWRRTQVKRAATAGVVLRDPNGDLAATFHHAACGGATRAANQVWPKLAQPWLVGVEDIDEHGHAFCKDSEPWRHTIRRDELAALLSPVVGRTLDAASLIFEPAADRFRIGDQRAARLYGADDVYVVLARKRGATKIRAPRFNVTERGATYTFEGRAFGHLVGLCQRGAMARARRGQTYAQILKAYFPKLGIAPE